MGRGTTPELAVDTLVIIESVLEHEEHDEIIGEMLKCDMECGTEVLKKFGKILIDVLQGISGQ